MCAECGADLRKEENTGARARDASVAMVHSIPELKVSDTEARNIGQVRYNIKHASHLSITSQLSSYWSVPLKIITPYLSLAF